MRRSWGPSVGKGQVTIPKEIRDHLQAQEGERVMFVLRGNEVILKTFYLKDEDLTRIATFDRKHFGRVTWLDIVEP